MQHVTVLTSAFSYTMSKCRNRDTASQEERVSRTRQLVSVLEVETVRVSQFVVDSARKIDSQRSQPP